MSELSHLEIVEFSTSFYDFLNGRMNIDECARRASKLILEYGERGAKAVEKTFLIYHQNTVNSINAGLGASQDELYRLSVISPIIQDLIKFTLITINPN